MNTAFEFGETTTTAKPAMNTEHSSHHSHDGGTGMDQTQVAAFIGHGVEFKGVIKYQGNVRIDGQLDGEVHANGTLYLGEQAILTGKIVAQAVISKGHITGDITTQDKVQLLAPAVLDGSIVTPSLFMEEGVTFNGTIEMPTSTAPTAELEDSLDSLTISETLTPA
jgi:cytoskeletal protein CcmA (bactofilin family)